MDLNLATRCRSLAFLGGGTMVVCKRILSISSPNHDSIVRAATGGWWFLAGCCSPRLTTEESPGARETSESGSFYRESKKGQAKGTGGVTNLGVGDQGVRLVTSLIMHMLHAKTMGI